VQAGHVLSREAALERLADKIRVCRHCDLARTRTQAVPGEGHPRASIMFVGEAPGAKEDTTGRPFVGASGRFLDTLLADIALKRADVFIANLNRCRPPGNRDPSPAEIEACSPYLRAQLRIIQPKVVCTLGRFAMNALIDPRLQISKVHGTPVEKAGMLFIPLFHPAAALYREALRETLIADMRAVRALLIARGLWQA
jgi:DNA polymerase